MGQPGKEKEVTDGDRPLNNDWVLGPEPLKWPEGLGNVRPTTSRGMLVDSSFSCRFCGALTKVIGDKLFCRKCGYFESCCDGGKEAIEGEC